MENQGGEQLTSRRVDPRCRRRARHRGAARWLVTVLPGTCVVYFCRHCYRRATIRNRVSSTILFLCTFDREFGNDLLYVFIRFFFFPSSLPVSVTILLEIRFTRSPEYRNRLIRTLCERFQYADIPLKGPSRGFFIALPRPPLSFLALDERNRLFNGQFCVNTLPWEKWPITAMPRTR